MLSNWSISKSAVLHRPNPANNVWIASITIAVSPATATTYPQIEYKYLVRAVSGELVAEKGAVHTVDVNSLYTAYAAKRRSSPNTMKDVMLLCEVEDVLQEGVKIQD